MNEQRQQDYLNLIQLLLNCRSDDEIREILPANQELLDVDFLQTVEAEAQKFSQQGDENTANRLQGLAMQLGEALNLTPQPPSLVGKEENSKPLKKQEEEWKRGLQSLSEEERQTYFQFLMQVLQATADSSGNSQVVYPLLANNTDKLDGVLVEILRRWGTNRLREAQADVAKSIAGYVVNFSNLIAQFPLGNKVSNIEIAITGYEVALTVYTQQAFPVDWAGMQNNLANAYSIRIAGERAENLERVIAYYQQALKVRTFDAFPVDWAGTQNNLAN
ncbi:hypothetical protein DP116_28370, partial [Brasilonema bromeliae SPC951]|nr:hypothetical protein [Brasilonema bromeliae SPC951]